MEKDLNIYFCHKINNVKFSHDYFNFPINSVNVMDLYLIKGDLKDDDKLRKLILHIKNNDKKYAYKILYLGLFNAKLAFPMYKILYDSSKDRKLKIESFLKHLEL